MDPTCKLCTNAPETRQHFIAECTAFDSERRELTDKLTRNQLVSGVTSECIKKNKILTQLVLDASAVLGHNDPQSEALNTIELQSREFLYKIHQKRIAKLKLIA